MLRRVTIEIDQELLERAEGMLGTSTIRATVEEALQRAVQAAADEREARRERQRRFFETLAERCDLEVMRSDEMWR